MSGLTLNLQSSYHLLQNAGVAGVYCLTGPAVWVNRDTEHGSLKSTDPHRPSPPGMPGSRHRCVESAPTHRSRRPGDISRVLLCRVFWALQSTEQPRPCQKLHRPQMHVKGLGQAARKGRSELPPFMYRRGWEHSHPGLTPTYGKAPGPSQCPLPSVARLPEVRKRL